MLLRRCLLLPRRPSDFVHTMFQVTASVKGAGAFSLQKRSQGLRDAGLDDAPLDVLGAMDSELERQAKTDDSALALSHYRLVFYPLVSSLGVPSLVHVEFFSSRGNCFWSSFFSDIAFGHALVGLRED